MAIKKILVKKNWGALINFFDTHERSSVFSRDGKVFILNDKCPHRGGPLHLCRKGNDGVLRCPWHGRKVKKREICKNLSAIFIASQGIVTLISMPDNTKPWPVKIWEQ